MILMCLVMCFIYCGKFDGEDIVFFGWLQLLSGVWAGRRRCNERMLWSV